MKNKLNVLLALTDQSRVGYKNMISDYGKFFSKSQGAFLGNKNTYTPREGVMDDPKKRGVTPVATTVDEKIEYFIEGSRKFVDALFSQEKTNASGSAKANLIVDGEDWGEYTSLELLRLRSLIESKDLGSLGGMIEQIPVRSDSEVWDQTDDSDYSERNVFETEMIKGVAKSTMKTPKVLPDPNLQGKELPVNYQPAVVQIDSVLELGDYTSQKFSGEWSQRERAMAMKRKNEIVIAVTSALKRANDVDAIESDLKSDKIFNYLFYGK